MITHRTMERSQAGKHIFHILVLIALCCALLYGYFVSSSIVNVLVRKEVEQNTTTVESRISTLEAQYLALKNEITLEYAYIQGFVDVSGKDYAVRSDLTRGITLREKNVTISE